MLAVAYVNLCDCAGQFAVDVLAAACLCLGSSRSHNNLRTLSLRLGNFYLIGLTIDGNLHLSVLEVFYGGSIVLTTYLKLEFFHL